MAIPLWILFIHGYATGFLTTWLGLVLVNIHPHVRKLAIAGLCYGLLTMIIRSLPIPFGANYYLLVFLLIFIVKYLWNLSFIKALITVLLGNLIMALCEFLSLAVIFEVFDTNMSAILSNNLYMLLIPLPQIIMMFFLIWLVYKMEIHLFDFANVLKRTHFQISIRKDKAVVILVAFLFTLMVFLVVSIIASHIVLQPQLFANLSQKNIPIILSSILIVITLIMLYFVGLLINLINQKHQFTIQQTYLETVDEMITAIRAQQHDQISHLQTLYGYMQLGYLEDARQYLEEMIGEIALSQRFANIKDPGLSALAYTKTALAIAKGIDFEISVSTDLNQLKISTYELNRILGNLIGNSFDHVSDLHEDMKKVWLRVYREDNYYVFEVANYGHIDATLASRIFDKGITTKSGDHAGLGLSIVRGIVSQHGGKIIFSNENNKVIFSVYLPVKEDKHETIRPKVGSPASPKLA